MSIESEIKQKKFRNEHQKAGINLIYTYNWVSDKMRFVFEQHDITSQQFNILRILRGAQEPLSTMQIRERMLDKMSDTSRIVDRLIKKSLVKKNVCRTDRRLVDITITKKGENLLQKLDRNDVEMDAALGNLSIEEAKTLNRLLDKVRNSE
ncbi:MAG: MarR family transcriptional regulator [Bacteroidetes bacterium]|nr:MarR family transcriptional regulator [Bacteroidota bacterium]